MSVSLAPAPAVGVDEDELPLERTFRDLIGSVVVTWKTDHVQQSLGLGALGHEVRFTGPAGS